jgi:glycerate 2-kinase
VGIGGSATNDGGAGMAQALGVHLLDAHGRELGPGGAELARLERIDPSGLWPPLRDVSFVIATDVDNPLVGPLGASVVYGPQKGASPEDVVLLDAALRRYADAIHAAVGVAVHDLPGAGAAGGIGASLVAFLGAEFRRGLDLVMEAAGFHERLARSDLVITGEGKFDRQSLHGKVPAGVMAAAKEASIPVVVLCGQAEIEPVPVRSLADAYGLERAMRDAAGALEDLAAELAERTVEQVG